MLDHDNCVTVLCVSFCCSEPIAALIWDYNSTTHKKMPVTFITGTIFTMDVGVSVIATGTSKARRPQRGASLRRDMNIVTQAPANATDLCGVDAFLIIEWNWN